MPRPELEVQEKWVIGVGSETTSRGRSQARIMGRSKEHIPLNPT
jgi:hypothetical protein